jgi:hypothetical protein
MTECTGHSLIHFALSVPEIGWPERHILVYRRGNDLAVRVLEDETYAFSQYAQRCSVVLNGLVIKEHYARIRTDHPIEHGQECRFTGTIGSDKGNFFPTADMETDSADCFEPPRVPITHIPGFKYDAAHNPPK